MTQSRKQARRQAAKRRREHYQAMRDHLDKLTATATGTFEHLRALVTYEMRAQFIRPLYAERPQWEPPPGRRAGMSAQAALDSVAEALDGQVQQAAEDALVYGEGRLYLPSSGN